MHPVSFLSPPCARRPSPLPTGSTAVFPVEPIQEVALGGTAQIQVYAAGDPPLMSHEIIWKRGDETTIVTDTRISLNNENKQLLILNVELEDGGTYRIDIRRQITALRFEVLATTFIFLDVHGT